MSDRPQRPETREMTAGRRWLRGVVIARIAVLFVVAPVLGIVALATGHHDSALPAFIITGLAIVLTLAGQLRRRRSSRDHGTLTDTHS